jgi:hypothetical protein
MTQDSTLINLSAANRYETDEYWEQHPNCVLAEGEIAFYDINENLESRRMKVGDGKTPIKDLPFFDAQINAITKEQIQNLFK